MDTINVQRRIKTSSMTWKHLLVMIRQFCPLMKS
ncbi:hypothetical protein Mgra_00007853 [Meloidogyne graminicola]|uniref:Uncharacterized protein n=1 Tax=Meloidogyne graminicola TaxID=189291 RepID=A0A8S9ZHS3_9BILA|nr:hypothetical protein Mgra_00007853 [Meloidogyne graminicola]